MNLIPITESLPEEDQEVIVWNGTRLAAAKYTKRLHLVTREPYITEMRGGFQVQKYPDSMDRSIVSYWSNVTHWMAADIKNPNENN